MPNWKKLITSGSDASLNSLNVSAALSASGLAYPNNDGVNGQVLATDGSGTLFFKDAAIATGNNTKLIQTVAAVTWSFQHDLAEKYPVIDVFDANDEIIIPQKIKAIDSSSLEIYFTSPRTGVAVATAGGLATSASFSTTASYIESSNVDGPEGMDSIATASLALTSSYSLYAITASYADNFNAVTASISQLSSSYIDFDILTNGNAPEYKEGRLYYSADDGALAFYNDEAEITLQIGQEFYKRVYNASGQRIDNGTPVRISGSQGDMPKIWPAYSQDIYSGSYNARSNKFIGIATHHIEHNSIGYVTEKGLVRGIDTSAFPAGSQLYIQTGSGNSVVGSYRTDPPPFPYDVIQAGIVVRSQSNGFVEVVGVRPITSDNISGIINISTQVINDEAVTIAKGTPVHAFSEGNGPIPRVRIAKANDPTLMPATFVTTQAISAGSQGNALAIGYIYDVDTSGYTVGDVVFVAPDGGYTNQKPTGSNELVQNLGVVLKAHATEGSGFMYGAGRSNDVPNLAGGKLWVGDEQGHFVTSSIVHLDETNSIAEFTGSIEVTQTVTATSFTGSLRSNTTVEVNDTLLSTQENTDVDTGTETIATVSTTLYDGAFFDYVAKDGTNYRAGIVMAVWDGSSVEYTDNSTLDIGDTSGVTLSVDINGTDARLRATVTSDNWNIKAFVRAL